VQAGLHAAAPAEARPVVLALNGSMVFAGQGLGAATGGLVIAAGGLAPLGLAAALLALGGVAVALRLMHPRRAALGTVKEMTP
jgi:DHA1 family inner membrane transport protein